MKKGNQFTETVKEFPFDKDLSIVGGSVISHRGKLHTLGGYDFQELITKKYSEASADDNDDNRGQHLCFYVENGRPIYSHSEFSFIRFIGLSCVYSKEYETAYIFGGMAEEVKIDDLLYPSCIISHKFTSKDIPQTIVYPSNLFQPKGRSFHSTAWDEEHQTMWIYGGGKMDTARYLLFDELWSWSSITATWTLHKTSSSPSKRWGHSMLYLKGKLYLFGGLLNKENRKTNKQIYILDLYNNKKMKWKSYPLKEPHPPHGTTMTVINVPGIGDRIFIIGGQETTVNKDLTYSGSIDIEQFPKDLKPLEVTVFDPNTLESDKFIIKNVPNVAYHCSTEMNGYVYIVGGLNQCNEDKLSYSTTIKQFDIIKFLYKTLQTDSIPEIKLIDPYIPTPKQEIFQLPKTEFPELTKMLNDFYSNPHEMMNPLVNVFFKDQMSPAPLEDFTLLALSKKNEITIPYDNKNYKLSSVYIKNEVAERRIGKIPELAFHLEINNAIDFAMYTYSGLILKQTSNFSDYKNFKNLIHLCLRLQYYRLIWLEISLHLQDLKPKEILEICSIYDPVMNCAAMENPHLQILKFVFHESLRLNFNSISSYELESIENLETVSKYMIDFLGSNEVPQMKIHFKIPGNSSFKDLNDLYQDKILEINQEKAAYFSSFIEFDNPSFKSNFDSSVVESVLQSDISIMLLDLCDVESCTDRILQSLKLINHIKNVSAQFLAQYYSSQIAELRKVVNESKPLRQQLLAFASSIKYPPLFGFIIHLLGNNGNFQIITKDNVSILCKHDFFTNLISPSYDKFKITQSNQFSSDDNSKTTCSKPLIQQFYVNTNSDIIYSLLLLTYIGPTCTLSDLPAFISRPELAEACLKVCNLKPCIVPKYVIYILRPFIEENIRAKSNKLFTTSEMVKNFRGCVEFEILDLMIKNAESNDWILKVKQTFRKDLNENELRVLLKAQYNQPIV